VAGSIDSPGRWGNRLNVPNLYLLISLALGGLYLWAVLPYIVSDSFSQIGHAYLYTVGELFQRHYHDGKPGDWLPLSMVHTFWLFRLQSAGLSKISISQLFAEASTLKGVGHTVFLRSGNWPSPLSPNFTLGYGPVTFLPQVLALEIARVLNLSWLTADYMSEVLNGVVVIAIGYVALRAAPYGKILLLIVLWLPSTLQLQWGGSYDGVLVALGILFIALLTRSWLQRPETVRSYWVRLVVLEAIGAVLTTTSPVYAPTILLSLTASWPRSVDGRVASRLFRKGTASAVAALLLAMIFVWWSLTHGFASWLPRGVHPGRQVLWQLHHPLESVGILARRLWYIVQTFAFQLVGFVGYFGWIYFYPWLTYLIGSLALLLGVAASCLAGMPDGVDDRARRLRSGWGLVTVVVISVLVVESMYVSWSAIGAHLVRGVEGRYFLPLFPLLLLPLIHLGRQRLKRPAAAVGVIAVMAVVLVAVMGAFTIRTDEWRYQQTPRVHSQCRSFIHRAADVADLPLSDLELRSCGT
jgi:uncharacterized membrane protein